MITKDEIILISKMMLTADDGCEHCAASLLEGLAGEFPEHEQTIKEIYLLRGINEKYWKPKTLKQLFNMVPFSIKGIKESL